MTFQPRELETDMRDWNAKKPFFHKSAVTSRNKTIQAREASVSTARQGKAKPSKAKEHQKLSVLPLENEGKPQQGPEPELISNRRKTVGFASGKVLTERALTIVDGSKGLHTRLWQKRRETSPMMDSANGVV